MQFFTQRSDVTDSGGMAEGRIESGEGVVVGRARGGSRRGTWGREDICSAGVAVMIVIVSYAFVVTNATL